MDNFTVPHEWCPGRNATTLITAGRPAASIRADRNHGRPIGRGTGGETGPAKAIPVHFDDYGVFASPLADFTREMQRRGMADRVIEVARGSAVTV